jgi:DNA-binding PadR family transcriptional regulator
MFDETFNEIIPDFSRFYILTTLYEGPCHGYGIITKFRERLGRDITPSLVYPFLQLLEQKGFVKHTTKPVGKKKRKVYELTNEGKNLCGRLFKRFATIVATAVEPSLNVCTHCGCKVYEGGYAEKIDGKETMFCCEHCAAAYKRERNDKS